MVQKLKVRTKLMTSFALLVVFTIIVGMMGIRGISQINYQNVISELVNLCLTDAQDAQAATLRYTLYGDNSYMTEAFEKTNCVLENAEHAKELMLSDENKSHVQDLIQGMTEYNNLNLEFSHIQGQINGIAKQRAKAAVLVFENIKELIQMELEVLTENSRSGLVSAIYVDRLMQLEEIQDATNQFRVSGYEYLAAQNDDERPILSKHWNDDILTAENLLISSLDDFNDEQVSKSLNLILNQVKVYKSTVLQYQNLEADRAVIQTQLREKAAVIMDSGRSVTKVVNDIIRHVSSQNKLLAILLSIVSAIIGIIIAFVLTKSITTQLGGEPYEIVDITSRIAKGDLKIDFPEKKLTGVYSAMQEMTAQITTIVNDIVSASNQVTSGSEQISSSAQEISSGTSEQASNMEEVSASVEQLNSNIQQNTENAQQSNVMAKKVAEDSQEGSEAVADTVSAMKDIAEKISVIQDIARSTNMLALNAAIEAARAGEAGRGFAVVASEVRKLAESSGAAAKDITEITQSSVHRAIAAQEKIEQIVPSMRKTAELVEEITMASQEQNKGAEQINSAIIQLDSVIQQNATASEELASMSEELLSQASTMKDTIGFFKVKNSDMAQVKYLQHESEPLKKAGSEQKIQRDSIEIKSLELDQDYESDFEEF
ncbi:methyl-accepting chemotaxis protein [Oceanispirochaeta crateris]|uniref:Methyl-accepting chemotaxis protein n=1 Tax=Oceanispirochaeta crateris TaxID=2518645 RepID=A0A5C1QQB4_9SPIO|nr:methyl-accepting chemotaxis protein [Oceanispirochaeta crateris]QEN08322.1 methyl-accepting chemotaxis protein [Oceanispirochaeta crateris]